MSRSKQENETQGNAACDADVYGHKAFSIAADVRAFVRARADGEMVPSHSLERYSLCPKINIILEPNT